MCMNENGMNAEAKLDADILKIAKMVEERENKTSVINPQRLDLISKTYEIAKKLARGTGAKVSYKLNDPFPSMGSVSIIGKSISFTETREFRKAASYASNVEVYPKTDGTVCITFTFHKLTTPIK